MTSVKGLLSSSRRIWPRSELSSRRVHDQVMHGDAFYDAFYFHSCQPGEMINTLG